MTSSGEDDAGTDRDDIPEYRDASTIGQWELADGLCSLQLLGDDPFLRMQATNLMLVDAFIMDIEMEVLKALHAEERTPPDAFFLSAQTQMWLFAAYEILRTWRERARDIEKSLANGTLKKRIDELEEDRGYRHHGHKAQAAQMRKFLKDPKLIEKTKEDRRVIYSTWSLLEYVRITLAKHQVPKNSRIAAFAPGYGRINRECGALDYELERDGMIFGTVNRRQIADGIRGFSDRTNVPTEDEIAEQERIWTSIRTMKRPDF